MDGPRTETTVPASRVGPREETTVPPDGFGFGLVGPRTETAGPPSTFVPQSVQKRLPGAIWDLQFLQNCGPEPERLEGKV